MNAVELDFEKAKARHILYKTRLRSILYGIPVNETPVISHLECSLGQWIYDRALKTYGHLPEVHELEKVHIQIHDAGNELITLYKNGFVNEARQGLQRTESIASELVQLLDVIRGKILSENQPNYYNPTTQAGGQIDYTELLELADALQDLDLRIRDQTEKSIAFAKQAENSEARLRDIMRQAPVGIAILRGEAMMVELANETYLSIVDRTEDQLVGKSLFEALPEVQEDVEANMLDVLKTGIPYYGNEFEVALRRGGKSARAFFNFVYQPLIEVTGVAGIIIIATEVTAQVLAKESLQVSENQFRNVVNQSQFAKAIFMGEDFVISMANEAVLKIWRRELAEVQGKKLFDVFPELNNQVFPNILRKVYQTGIVYRENEAVAYVDGPGGMRKHFLDFQYAPMFDVHGAVNAIIVSVNDVTDKVHLRERIADDAQRLKLATEGTRLATWDMNLETMEVIHSARLSEIFGFADKRTLSHAEMRGMVHAEDRVQIVERAFDLALQTGVYHYEARIIHSDRSVHWVRTQGKIIFDDQNKPVRMLGTMMDINEEKNAELALRISEDKYRTLADQLESKVQQRTQELTISNNELMRTNMELAQFAYVASHDLQEPLRKIQTFATRIVETEYDRLSEKGRDYFSRMQSSSMRMQQLIIDLLAFSRATSTEKHFEKADLNEVMRNVQEQMSEEIHQKQATLHVTTLPVRTVIYYQIEQLFTNLLANALKFTRPGVTPVIHVRSGEISGELIPLSEADPSLKYQFISVADNGIGFDQQYKDRIFQVFQRLHSRSAFEGTGIGLALCKKIVDNHRGLIDAIGKPGVGATFIIYFPMRR